MTFPHYTQLDTMDCGPTCLRIVVRFYGKNYSLQNLRERCHITREGVSLMGISDAAESIGLRTAGVKITWEQLRDQVDFPCIVYWNQEHFVVVYKITRKRGQWWVWVSDPASGLLKYSEEQFKKSWIQSRELSNISIVRTQSSRPSNVPGIQMSSDVLIDTGIVLLLEPTPIFYKEKVTKTSG